MKILIADDQSGVRSALRLILEQHPECSIVAEADNTMDLLEKAAQTNPDLVLLDAELAGLPDKRGEQIPGALEELIARLQGECCEVRVIVLSIRPEVRGQVMACGVDAFVSKADPPDSLLSTIKQLCLGGAEKK
jgi:DNA-binding NarL/FixJ family response regulator